MRLPVLLIVACVTYHYRPTSSQKYDANWASLDTRPLPEWYDRAKIGIMVHWGIYSVPAYGPPSASNAEWFWYHWIKGNREVLNFMSSTYPEISEYESFAKMLTGEKFDPVEWVKIFKNAGAKYFIITSKHNDGFAMFNSNYSNRWNSVEKGPHRDIVHDLQKAVNQAGLNFGIYYHLLEWRNRLYLEDRKSKLNKNEYAYEKVWPEAKQLVNTYRPSIFWADGDLQREQDYWNGTGFVAWLYNNSPVRHKIVVNDRWGASNTRGRNLLRGNTKPRVRHGDFYTNYDKYNPRTLQKHKWENVFSLDKGSWGYRRNMGKDLMTIQELLETVISTVSCGGNALINVGAMKDGTIPKEFVKLLNTFGEWMQVNGAAIHGTTPWKVQSEDDSNVWYTCSTDKYDGRYPIIVPWQPSIKATYAIFLKWPENDFLRLRAVLSLFRSRDQYIEILGRENKYLMWIIKNDEVHIQLPPKQLVPSRYAWTLKITPKT